MLLTTLLLQTALTSVDPGGIEPPADDLGGIGAAQVESALWWHDYDNDGLQDAFAITRAGAARLLRNMGDGSFNDVTEEVGLAGVRQARFAQWRDYDGDGKPDLFIGTEGGASLLYRGQRGGGFVESAALAGLQHSGVDLFAHWLDYDEDGRADLHVRTQARDWIYHNVGGGAFESIDLGELGAPGSTVRTAARGPVSVDGAGEAASSEDGPDHGERARAEMGTRTGTRRPVDAPAPPTGAIPVPNEAGLTLACADAVSDQAPGATECLQASSLGTLGMLYPLSADFNVAAAGNVGIGTVAPADRLHVHDGDLRISGGAGREARILDGQNDAAIVLDASGNGLNNSIRLYRDGVLSMDYGTTLEGHVQRFRNSATGSRVYTAGVHNADGAGYVQVNNDAGSIMVNIDADSDDTDNAVESGLIGIRSLGTGGQGGELQLQSNDGDTRVHALGGGSAFHDGGLIEIFNGSSARTVRIDGDDPSAGTGAELFMYNDDGVATIRNDSDTGPTGAGQLTFSNGVSADTKLWLKGSGPGSDLGGEIELTGADFGAQLLLDGESDNGGARVSVRNANAQNTVALVGDDGSDAGALNLWDRSSFNNNSVQLQGRDDFGTGSKLALRDDDGNQTVEIDGSDAAEGEIALWESDGSRSFRMFNNKLTVYDAFGVASICMNGANGAKNAIVGTRSYGQRLLYAVESPEVWFEDVGSSALVAGQARVELDPMFLETVTVDAEHSLKVFITLTGASERVYVEKGLTGFSVHELDGGQSNATFDWRVMAKRKGLEDVRLDAYEEEGPANLAGADPLLSPSHATPSDDERVESGEQEE